MSDKEFFVHESSYIDDNVKIGKGTKIWHFCHIQSGAVIERTEFLLNGKHLPNLSQVKQMLEEKLGNQEQAAALLADTAMYVLCRK